MHLIKTLYLQRLLILLATSSSVIHAQDDGQCVPSSDDKVVHYCNLGAEGAGPGGRSMKISPFPNDGYPLATSQRFKAGEAGNVSSVTIGISRVGLPGGKMIFSIRQVDESTGHPGELVGILGEIEIDTIPEVDWCSLPKLLETVTIEGLVSGLEPGIEYYLHMIESEEDLPKLTGGGACGPGNVWAFDIIPTPNNTEQHIIDWPDEEFPPGAWGPWEPNLRIRAKIEGSFLNEPDPITADIEPAVAITWDSKLNSNYHIQSSIDLENWALAVDSIEGTGERLTQFFKRTQVETYYRVEEHK